MKNFCFKKTENRQTIGVTSRQIVLSFCFIAFAFACFAQDINVRTQTTQTPDQGIRKLTKAETLHEMQINYPALYSQYNSGRRQMSVGLTLTGFGVGSCIFGYALGKNWVRIGNMDDPEFLFIMAGLILAPTGIPILTAGAIRNRRALRAFNNQYYLSEKPTPQFQFNVYPNRVGLAYVF